VECLLASVNPLVVKGSALTEVISRVLKDIAGLQSPPAEVWRSTHDELTRLFQRLKREDAEASAISAQGQGLLQTLLFRPDLPNEALRLSRADVVIAVAAFSPSSVTAMRTDILACIAEERSAVVRDRLGVVPLADG